MVRSGIIFLVCVVMLSMLVQTAVKVSILLLSSRPPQHRRLQSVSVKISSVSLIRQSSSVSLSSRWIILRHIYMVDSQSDMVTIFTGERAIRAHISDIRWKPRNTGHSSGLDLPE
jgi:hypothetical protein